MKNNGRKLLSSVCAFAMIAGALYGVTAQDRKNDKKFEVEIIDVGDGNAGGKRNDGELIAVANMVRTSQQSGDSVFQFLSQEMSFDSRLVKDAPFSASIVSETIQNLTDGNRIVQRSEGRIYRDSRGRTRSDRTYQMGGSSEQKQVINIRDWPDGSSYSLDPETRIARKSPYVFVPLSSNQEPGGWIFTPPFNPNAPSHAPRRVPIQQFAADSADPNAPDQPKSLTMSGEVLQGAAIIKVQPPYPAIARAAKASGAVQVHIKIGETGKVIEASAIKGHPLLRGAALQAARQWVFKPTEISGVPVKVQGVLTFNFTLDDGSAAQAPMARNVRKYPAETQNLGKRNIEGVECEGTRSVTTMPAGAIGNEQPIQTVYETWYSPELQLTILSKRSDPRFGESTYHVTNIVRAEPDAALFEIPSDYTVIDSRARKIEVDVKVYEEMRRKIEMETRRKIEEEKKKIEGARKPNDQ